MVRYEKLGKVMEAEQHSKNEESTKNYKNKSIALNNFFIVLMVVSWTLTGFSELSAKTIYYVKVDGIGDGTSWANAAGNIQDMIDKAIAGDEVWVAAGTYFPTYQTSESDIRSKTFLIKNGVHLFGGFAGNETSIDGRAKSDSDGYGKTDGNGKIESWEFTNETVLSGNIDSIADEWEKIDFFGEAWRYSIAGNAGNCSTVVTASSEIIDETWLDGFTVSGGNGNNGGIDTRGKTIVQSCVVSFNTSRGLYNALGEVKDCHVLINAGTGIYNETGIVKNCTVEMNARYVAGTANAGGGICNDFGEIVNCMVMSNQAIVFQGNSINYGQQPSVYGGGIYNIGGKIDKCTVVNNTIFSYNTATGGSMLDAYAFGGGIYTKEEGGVIANCCVFNNKVMAVKRSTHYTSLAAAQGGGIYYPNGIVYNSTVVNNKGIGNGESNIVGDRINCISSATNASQDFIRPTTFVGRATTAQQEDELLQADWQLKTGSQYIDAGTLTDLPDWLIAGTDLAGNPRTTNGKISDGAYEYNSLTGMEELRQADFKIFPNPATDYITVSGLQNNETLFFYNMDGQLILTRQTRGETENITVDHLPAAVYFVKTTQGEFLKWIKK